jgi:multidrug efflux pump
VSLFLLLFNQPFGFVSLLGVDCAGRHDHAQLGDPGRPDRPGHRRRPLAWDAVIDATVRRARPILLTAGTAIFAMIPLSRSVFWGRWRWR